MNKDYYDNNNEEKIKVYSRKWEETQEKNRKNNIIRIIKIKIVQTNEMFEWR